MIQRTDRVTQTVNHLFQGSKDFVAEATFPNFLDVYSSLIVICISFCLTDQQDLFNLFGRLCVSNSFIRILIHNLVANCKCKLDTCTVELSESERRSGWKPLASVLGDGALAAGGHTGNQNAVHGVSS